MSPRVQAAGVELAYEEQGAGPTVLLIHGIGDDRRSWLPVADAISGRARAIVYDRRGYGESEAPVPYTRTTVEEQAEDAAAVLAELGDEPAVVCGADFGALVCLDLLRRHGRAVAAAVLVDPAVYPLSVEATTALAEERELLEITLREEDPPAAVAAYLERSSADAGRVDRARDTPAAFFADYAGLATWPVSRRELRATEHPVAVVISDSAPTHVREMAEALASLLPGARRAADPAAAVRDLLPRAEV